MNDKPLILDLNDEALMEWMSRHRQPGFRRDQLVDWLYRKHITKFSEMSNLSASFRDQLDKAFTGLGTYLVDSAADTDGTVKYQFGLKDGHSVESVYLPKHGHYTLCISSQVGCALGCRFCATGNMGIIRNLSSGEILSQIIHMLQLNAVKDHGNIVFMGMGEPLLNMDAITSAIDRLTKASGFGWSPRRITVSTVGIIPEIRHFSDRLPGVNFAISLNASDDKTRSRLMPINKKYPLKALMAVLKTYPLPSRQHKLTYEYVMLRNVNDSPEDAARLVRLLDKRRDKINLIPFNEVPFCRFRSSERNTINTFSEILSQAGFTVTVRNSQGSSIAAGCGQLVADVEKNQEP